MMRRRVRDKDMREGFRDSAGNDNTGDSSVVA